jgi:hypothetical protein
MFTVLIFDEYGIQFLSLQLVLISGPCDLGKSIPKWIEDAGF